MIILKEKLTFSCKRNCRRFRTVAVFPERPVCGCPVLHKAWLSGVWDAVMIVIPDALWQPAAFPMKTTEVTRSLCIYERSATWNTAVFLFWCWIALLQYVQIVPFQKLHVFYARICLQSRIFLTSCIFTNDHLKVMHHQSSYQRTNLLKSHCIAGSVSWDFQGCQLHRQVHWRTVLIYKVFYFK